MAWYLVGVGIVGLFGNGMAGQYGDRSAMGVTVLSLAVPPAASLATITLTGRTMLFLIPFAIWGAAGNAGVIANQLRVMNEAPEARAFASALSVTIAQVGIGLGALIGGKVIDAERLAALASANAAIGIAGLAVALLIVVTVRRSKQQVVPAACDP